MHSNAECKVLLNLCFLLKLTLVAPLTIYRKWLHNVPIKHLFFFSSMSCLYCMKQGSMTGITGFLSILKKAPNQQTIHKTINVTFIMIFNCSVHGRRTVLTELLRSAQKVSFTYSYNDAK